MTSNGARIRLLTCLYVIYSSANVASGSPYSQQTSYVLYVIHRNHSSQWTPVLECQAMGAYFGKELKGSEEIAGCGQSTSPHDACGPISSLGLNETDANKQDNPNLYVECSDYFALISRGNCTFEKKAYEAQEGEYGAAIIYNNVPGDPPFTMGVDAAFEGRVQIPAFMISYSCAQQILVRYPYSKGYVLLVKFQAYYDFVKYLIPFVCVVGLCFLIMVIGMGLKLVRDRRRQNRRRLSRSHLRKIPTKKYKKGEEVETCPICLDDFENGDKLRVLPCKHSYHCKCVDPWLTKNRKVCPVCKRKVVPSSGDSSDTDTEPTSSTSTTTTNDAAPLLQGSQVGNSTFYGNLPSSTSEGARGDGSASVLSPPSSPDSASALPPTTRGIRIGRFVVPGFRRTQRGSTERLVVPLPPPEEEGEDNNGYEVDVPQFPPPSGRRKRHPAATRSNRGAAQPTSARLTLDESEESEDEAGGGSGRTKVLPLTVPNKSSELEEKRTKEQRDGTGKRKKKSRNLLLERKEAKGGRTRRITPASAPANLPCEMESEEEEEIVRVHPNLVNREDSIQLEMEDDDMQTLVSCMSPPSSSTPPPTSSANRPHIV